MTIYKQHKEGFDWLFQQIRLGSPGSGDQTAKIKQILSYLNIIHSQLRGLSRNRPLVLVDCAAGNCYLSFLVYYFYSVIDRRDIVIHCIDTNEKLMRNNRKTAHCLGFSQMKFHSGDILSFKLDSSIDLLYTLHACDKATDKALYLGHRLKARSILSVSCCQHTISKKIRMTAVKGISRYKPFKEKITYYVADTMRAHLLGMKGFEVDIFDFTSVRNTDKNIMLRARRNNNIHKVSLENEYSYLKEQFGISPYLEELLSGAAQ